MNEWLVKYRIKGDLQDLYETVYLDFTTKKKVRRWWRTNGIENTEFRSATWIKKQ